LSTGAERKKSEIAKRIAIANGELLKASVYNYIVINDKLEESVNEVRQIIDDRKKQMEFIRGLIDASERLI
jgi:guanylate kinase